MICSCPDHRDHDNLVQAGNIACFWGNDLISRFISFETSSVFAAKGVKWAPSHVGILSHLPIDDDVYLVESTSLSKLPCKVWGQPRSGLQAQCPMERIHEYVDKGGRVEIYGPTPLWRFTEDELEDLQDRCDYLVRYGHEYDTKGAIFSGTRLLSKIWPAEADLERLFCSEFVAMMLMAHGRMCPGRPDRFHPGRLISRLLKNGIYRHIGGFF